MNQSSIAFTPQRLRATLTSPWFRWIGLIVLILIASLLGWRWWLSTQLPAPYNAAKVVDEAGLEEKWGIRVTLVGISGDGGLVDFRFIVVDPDKALALIDNNANRPVLVDEATNTLLLPSPSPSSHRGPPIPGQTFIMLYPNPRGIVQIGSQVSVIIGDIRLEHLVAQ